MYGWLALGIARKCLYELTLEYSVVLILFLSLTAFDLPKLDDFSVTLVLVVFMSRLNKFNQMHNNLEILSF